MYNKCSITVVFFLGYSVVPLSPVQEKPHQSQLGFVCLVRFVLLSLYRGRKTDTHVSKEEPPQAQIGNLLCRICFERRYRDFPYHVTP